MVKKKISLNNIVKKYDKELVFSDFSYEFKSKGLYVLYGESGCGKTTLLNLIAGITNFQDGSIIINGYEFEKEVDKDLVISEISYLTQENYFIDYLTVEDNLKLSLDNQILDIDIMELLITFDLSDKLQQFPESLSGGEKQRLALLQTVLQNKKILLIDEPTASIDFHNKQKTIKLLKYLSDNMLIICSTHDDDVKSIASEVLEFNSLISKKKDNDIVDWDNFSHIKIEKKIKLYEYIRKQKKYSKSEKKSNFILFIVMCFTLLVVFLCNDPRDKLLNSINRQYKINYLRFSCPLSSIDYCSNFLDKKEIVEFNYVYNENLPKYKYSKLKCDNNNAILDYEEAVTLPFNKDLFPYINLILYGDYFTKTNQVILGYNEALRHSSDLESLIGTTIKLNLYNYNEDMEIVGIFKPILEESKNIQKYFVPNGVSVSNNNDNFSEYIYINGKFANQYLKDEADGRISTIFNVYYKSYDELFKDYSKYKTGDKHLYNTQFIYDYNFFFINEISQLSLLAIFLYPVSFISILVSLLFYFNTKSLEFNYKKHIFSIYQYYGFSLKQIKKTTFIYYLNEILKIFTSATLLTVLISFVVNIINNKLQIIPFEIFTISFLSILLLIVIMCFVLLIMIWFFFNKIKKVGWYSTIKEREDLL